MDGQPTFITLPADRSVAAAAGTVTNWSGSFMSAGQSYNYTMVGTDPAQGSQTTVIPTEIIPIIFQFSDGTTLDPTTNVCGDTASAVSRVVNSPLFQSTSFSAGSTNVGTTQYIDAFQRANFWNYVSTTAPDYHVLLQSSPNVMSAVTIQVPRIFGSTVAGPCAKIGEVSVAYFQFQLNKLIQGLPSTSLPIFLTYNTFFTQVGQCCILGFHTVFGSGSNQLTVSVAAYSDPGIFSVPIQDIHALSHEIGEWLDDPFTNNIVPGWTGGQIGTSCSTLLEVGDPVTGNAFTSTLNGFTYHPEDLVFLPWFAKASASSSVNGWYTFLNFYSAPSKTC